MISVMLDGVWLCKVTIAEPGGLTTLIMHIDIYKDLSIYLYL